MIYDEFDWPRTLLLFGASSVIMAMSLIPLFPATFLPPFNEGTLLVSMRLTSGITLSESATTGIRGGKTVARHSRGRTCVLGDSVHVYCYGCLLAKTVQ